MLRVSARISFAVAAANNKHVSFHKTRSFADRVFSFCLGVVIPLVFAIGFRKSEQSDRIAFS